MPAFDPIGSEPISSGGSSGVEGTDVQVAASGVGVVSHAATGSVSVDLQTFVEVSASAAGSVAHAGAGSVSVDLLGSLPSQIEVSCAGLGSVVHSAVASVSVRMIVPAQPVASITLSSRAMIRPPENRGMVRA